MRFADEIVVVDTGSTDRTVELARAGGARVVVTAWQGFAGTKNFALDQARGDWVFSLDTDERVSAALQDGILAVVQADGPLNGYRVPRKNYFGGRWIRHLGWYPDYTLRLWRREQGRFRDREVHEEVEVEGKVGTAARPRWITIPTAIWRNTPPARTATPGWPPGRCPSRAAGPGPENSGGGHFSPFCGSIS